MNLLTTGNPKTDKGAARGYLTAIMHLAPADLSGRNVCPWATKGCKAACLNTAGRGGIFRKGETTNAIQRARLARTDLFFADRAFFLRKLSAELEAHTRRAMRLGMKPAVRLNGTSDLPWESIAPELFRNFPTVQFYDYTKSKSRVGLSMTDGWPANYGLTLSFTEEDDVDRLHYRTGLGINVAVVFDKVPATFGGITVVDGDHDDLRFLDQRGVIVGLKAKGRAKQDATGFVVRQEN